MKEKQCRYYLVKGKVQGVWYRIATQEKALKLHLTGWVKNLPDKQVALMACGDPDQLDRLNHWLWQGPPAAIVSHVEEKIVQYEHFHEFVIK